MARRDVVDRSVGRTATQGAARRSDRAPRPVTPSHSASRSTASTASSSTAADRFGRRHARRSRSESRVGGAARLERGELAQHLAADRADRRPLHVRAEGVGRARCRCCAARRGAVLGSTPSQASGQRRPPVPGLARAPLVDLRRGSPHRHDLAVVGDEPGGIRELDDEGGVLGVDVERQLGDPEVADRQATGAQHAGRLGAPRRGELVDVGEALAGGATGGGVDERDRCGPRGRAAQLGPPVQAAAAQHEPDLAGQRDAVGRHRHEQVVLEQPAGRRATRARRSAARRRPDPTSSARAWRASRRGPRRSSPGCGRGRRARAATDGPQLVHRARRGPRRTCRAPRARCARRGRRRRRATARAAPPQVLDDGVDGRGVVGAEQVQQHGAVGGVARDDEGLEHLEVAAVEGLDGPLHAGAGAGAGGEARQVGRRRAREIGAREHEVDELCVAATADVVGEAAARGGHPPNLVPGDALRPMPYASARAAGAR